MGQQLFLLGSAAGDNATVFEFDDARSYDTFLLTSSAGVMDVYGSLDGANYAASAINMTDCCATDSTPVIETAAGRIYGIRGPYRKIKVLQKGATAVVGAVLSFGSI